MVNIWCALRGYSVAEISGGTPGWALNRLAKEKIAFWNIVWLDALTVRIRVFRGTEQAVCKLAEASMCTCEIKGTYGLARRFGGLIHRPILLCMLLLDLLFVMILPNFLFFFDVEGNETIPEQVILREVEQAGVGFGIYGPKIYPKQVKDYMIGKFPKLQWVTVVQNGCRGTVVVREREDIPEIISKKGLTNIVASQSGVITGQTIYVGQAMRQVGDTVSKGDLLVSGVVDLERTYLLERAYGEVFARTWRDMTVVIPKNYGEKKAVDRVKRCGWLVLGQKRIKIFGNSGISYGSCDKMIDRKKLTLPQGLTLPVALEIETFSFYVPEPRQMQRETAEQILMEFVHSDVTGRMIAGEVLNQHYVIRENQGQFVLRATLECHEMIAETVEAKWNNEEFAND